VLFVSWREQALNTKERQTFSLNSRFWRTFLVALSALLIFAGPTYAVLVLWWGFDLDYTLLMSLGFVLFLLGFGLLVFLVRKKTIS